MAHNTAPHSRLQAVSGLTDGVWRVALVAGVGRRAGRKLWAATRAIGVVLALLILTIPAAPLVGAAAPGDVPVGAAVWRWPLDGAPRVVRRFDPPANPYGPGHRGVDLAAEPGATIRAAGDGVIWFAGSVGGLGVVSVRHPDGRRTTYEPVHPVVKIGAKVRAGSVLGHLGVGHQGCPAVACLHWGLLAGDAYQDPLSLLSPGRVRLYPG